MGASDPVPPRCLGRAGAGPSARPSLRRAGAGLAVGGHLRGPLRPAPARGRTYDANGNLTSDGWTTFVYDAENRLVSASGAKNATLAYDPLGRLWQVSSPSNGTFRFYYDGDRLIEEYDASGNRIRVFGHGPGADEPVVWWENMGGWYQRRLLHADHQGSIVALNDDAGNALNISDYDAWGIPNAGNWGRFMYTGQAWLGELGLYYYKARFYSPTLGGSCRSIPSGTRIR